MNRSPNCLLAIIDEAISNGLANDKLVRVNDIYLRAERGFRDNNPCPVLTVDNLPFVFSYLNRRESYCASKARWYISKNK